MNISPHASGPDPGPVAQIWSGTPTVAPTTPPTAAPTAPSRSADPNPNVPSPGRPGGSRLPASHETVDNRQHYVKQDGQAVFKFAVRKSEEMCRRVLERNNIDVSQIDLFVSHQANRRIITAAAERLGLPDEKVVINLEMYGNTTAATIPLALADAVRQERVKKGDLVLLASVGAGFTAGAVLLRWSL